MAHALLPRIEDLAKKLLGVPCEPSRDLGVQEDLEELRRMARWIQAVLNDAEKMEIHNESVRLWLEELKGVVYDAEDVLDEYDYEVLRAKVEAGIQADEATTHIPSERKCQQVSESTITTTIPLDASFCGKIADNIRKIRTKFEKISRHRAALHLREGDGQRQPLATADRPPSSPVVDETKLYGRRDDLERVINRLLCSDECKKSKLSVLPIVGMGGVGKTTLVQHVYNDPRICDHFQMKGWVCVSDDFTVEKLTSRIVESLTKRECHLKEFSVLQEKLKELLDGKRFLLVLDDVWNEKPSLWESLQQPLRFGVQGSAVVTTTRNESVAKIMQTMPFHHLDCLSFGDCWTVFIKHAFVDRDPADCRDLMDIGKKIVTKCGGLPLAAKSLGGLLSYESDFNVWEEVLRSNIWDLDHQADGIIPALRLSYLHLPSYLKPCFLYASVFPKDFIFRKNDLILLWMAQGFLWCKGNKEAEDVGNMYLKELVQRSSFQYYSGFYNEEDPGFVIHDLIHDLAQHISGLEFFQMEGDEAHVPCPNVVRHLLVVNHKAEDLEKTLHSPGAVRTLMVKASWDDLRLPRQMLQLLESLRALDLRCSRINELPDSIGNLKHLRYLNLDGTNIAGLPDSICKLYNLQTLSLLYCRSLTWLPRGVKNLCNLRCLKIEGTSIESLPSGIGRLTSLRALDEFRVGLRRRSTPTEDFCATEDVCNNLSLRLSNEECGGIEELKDLIHLRGRLQISNLQYVMDAEDAAVADLRNKRNIRELVLSWGIIEPASPSVQTQVLENLRAPDHLEMLRIHSFNGLILPNWMGDDPSSLSKLVRVVIQWCNQCTSLPPLGQLPSLKHLDILSAGMVKAVGSEFRGHASVGFPALEELIFRRMLRWVKWELAAGRGNFPRLHRLCILECPTLESTVPLYLLPALEELHIWDCPRLTSIKLRSGPSSMGPPPISKMTVVSCPLAGFTPEEDVHEELLLLPPTLRELNIRDCPSLVEWCERGGGCRLARVPGAKLWRSVANGEKIVSTSVPDVVDGKLVLKFTCYPSFEFKRTVRPLEGEEGDGPAFGGGRGGGTRGRQWDVPWYLSVLYLVYVSYIYFSFFKHVAYIFFSFFKQQHLCDCESLYLVIYQLKHEINML